jgi:hypothetical protein
MMRLTIAAMLAVGIASAASQAIAQSPDPALLAPGQSGRMLAPPRATKASPVYTSPTPGGTPPHMTGRRGKHLSHPRVHYH